MLYLTTMDYTRQEVSNIPEKLRWLTEVGREGRAASVPARAASIQRLAASTHIRLSVQDPDPELVTFDFQSSFWPQILLHCTLLKRHVQREEISESIL